MRVVVDASDPVASLGEVAVWSFDVRAWGECVQAGDESQALNGFARRLGLSGNDLEVGERISGPGAVFSEDLLPATDDEILRTIDVLDSQRIRLLSMLDGVPPAELDVEDADVRQPSWMSWRTPNAIVRHVLDTESRAYPRWCGLSQLEPIADLDDELERSGVHVRRVIRTMPRTFRTEHRGETWTPVKLLRRLAWHERVELVFLRRRLDAARGGVPHRPPSTS